MELGLSWLLLALEAQVIGAITLDSVNKSHSTALGCQASLHQFCQQACMLAQSCRTYLMHITLLCSACYRYDVDK